MPDATMFWNLILSGVAAGVLLWIKNVSSQLQELRSILSTTREQIARDYALKVEVDKDVQKLLDRFDRFEVKLDNLIEKILLSNSTKHIKE